MTFLVFVRVSSFVAVLPGFRMNFLSVRTVLSISICLTIVLRHVVLIDGGLLSQNFELNILSVLTEAIVGVFFGLKLRIFFYTVNVVGAFVAHLLSLSHLFGSGGVASASIFGNILNISAIAMIFAFGLHLEFVEYLVKVFTYVPIGGSLSSTFVFGATVSFFTEMLFLSLQLSVPFVVISLVYNLMVGVLNKAMPQLMVVLIGAPLISMVSLWSFTSLSGTMLSIWYVFYASIVAGGPIVP